MASPTIGSDTTCWEIGGSQWAEETSRQENSTPHLTQNLKVLGSRVTSLIRDDNGSGQDSLFPNSNPILLGKSIPEPVGFRVYPNPILLFFLT